MIALDFFTVPTATFKVLFVLVILSQDRRQILHVNATEQPTAIWTARQLLETCGPEERTVQPPLKGVVRELLHVGGLHHEHVRMAA